MGFEWDPKERAAFDAEIAAHLAHTFPEARQEWIEDHRRLLLHFPDGTSCMLYEPNFFFSFPSFTKEHLFRQAAEAIAAQHQTLERGGVI